MQGGAEIRGFTLIFVLSLLGAVLKILAYGYGSRAAFVDAMTCIANIVAAIFALYAVSMARQPPDRDHPYGHRRFEIAGILWITIIYAIIAGFTLAQLIIEGVSPQVLQVAPLYAAAGTGVYALVIIVANKMGLLGRAFAAFTFTEVYEGIGVTLAALGGALYSTLIDYAGAIALLAYLYYELYEHVASLTEILTERIPPHIAEEVKKIIEKHGLRVVSLRLRPVLPGEYIGDAVVRVDKESLREAHRVIDRVERELQKRRVALVIHYEPA